MKLRLLIYVISTYFLFINFVFSEVYICSYKWGDEIRMSPKEKRTGSTFTAIYEDGSRYKWKDVVETKDRIILIDPLPETVYMKVIWKESKTYSMVGINYSQKKHTKILNGKCTVTN
tara:strand:+ start:442 stop:792 length:351 start_codon:yes stop_codon:yes gene_type:complete